MNALLIGTCLLTCVWLSWYITRRFVLFAMEQQLLDIPNARSSHKQATPRGGGISFVLVVLAAVADLYIAHHIPGMTTVALFCGSTVAFVGFLDDRYGMPILPRLLIHFSAATIAVLCFFGFPSLTLTPRSAFLWIGTACVIFGFTWFVNLFNFMDGIDGLAASESASIAAVCCGITAAHEGFHAVSMLFAVLAVASIGFLIWNWYPAQIFMGDAGSCFLGFSLGAFSLMAIARHAISLWSPLILAGVFIIDATTTLLRRMARNEKWYKPHRLHAFQQATNTFGHRNVTLFVIATNLLWLMPWAILSEHHQSLGFLFLVLAWSPIALLVYLFHGGEVLCEGAIPRWRSAVLILQWNDFNFGEKLRNRFRLFAKENMPSCRVVVLFVMCVGCAYLSLLSEKQVIGGPFTRRQLLLAGVLSLGQFLSFLGFGLHRCHWHLISIEEVPNIVGMSLAGTLFGLVVAAGISRSGLENTPASALVLDAALIVVGIVIGHVLAATLSRDGHLKRDDEGIKRVVIYGADAAGISISSDLRRLGPSYRLVGFVDARKSLTGVHLGGRHVLGSNEDIRRLVDTYGVDHVLISSSSLRTQSGQLFLRQCQMELIDYRIIPSIESGIGLKSTVLQGPSSVTP
jgi:Fuc2NAc and GlcNAc transferase